MRMSFINVYNCQKSRFIRRMISFIWGHPTCRDFVSLHCPYLFSKLFYYKTFGKIPNLKEPKDRNEKLLRLKINEYRTNQYIADCADKYKVRDIIAKKGYASILTKLYAVYDSPYEINYDLLPNKFVIKMNHGCAYNLICTDKDAFDKQSALESLLKWDAEDYGVINGEWQYRLIKHKIIIEEYIEALDKNGLIDYKFNCCNGTVHSIVVCYGRVDNNAKTSLYSPSWERLSGYEDVANNGEKLLPRPKNFDKMLKIATDLSKDFKFVRVDLYDTDDRVIFGELTFSPYSCVDDSYSQELLDEMGDMIKL